MDIPVKAYSCPIPPVDMGLCFVYEDFLYFADGKNGLRVAAILLAGMV